LAVAYCGPLVRQAFEDLATGQFTKQEVIARATEAGLRSRKGLKLSPQSFGQMMRNTEAVDELDVQGILAFAERVLPRALDLWVQASLDYKQRLQALFFPEGIAYDGNRFNRTAVTAPLFSYLAAKNFENEGVVSRLGIEPRTRRLRVRPHRLRSLDFLGIFVALVVKRDHERTGAANHRQPTARTNNDRGVPIRTDDLPPAGPRPMRTPETGSPLFRNRRRPSPIAPLSCGDRPLRLTCAPFVRSLRLRRAWASVAPATV
jgi:hypothetical protein